MVVMANNSSAVVRSIGAYVVPWANVLGLNMTWNFYSPDPANVLYLDYKIIFEDQNGEATREPIEGFFPEEKTSMVFNLNHRRFLSAMRFMTVEPKRLQNVFADWFCRKNPGATRVVIKVIMEKIPNIEAARLGTERAYNEMYQVEKRCNQEADEVAI